MQNGSENPQIGDAIQALGMHSPSINQLSGGDISETYSIENGEERYVLQLMHPSFAPEHQLISTYFHPNRGAKIAGLQFLLEAEGIPVPKVLSIGKGEPAPWIVTEFAHGENLTELYPVLTQDQRLIVAKNMGRLLAKIHDIPITDELINTVYPNEKPNLKSTSLKHVQRFEILCGLLYDKGTITRRNLTKALAWYGGHRDIIPNMLPTLVHRDYFQRNVFVDPDSLEITSVIDWGDTAEIDDPIKDAILAAWWIADNFDTKENRDVFEAFLEEYNQYASSPIDLTRVNNLLDVYNLQWYLELAFYETYRGNKKELASYLERAMKILEK